MAMVLHEYQQGVDGFRRQHHAFSAPLQDVLIRLEPESPESVFCRAALLRHRYGNSTLSAGVR